MYSNPYYEYDDAALYYALSGAATWVYIISLVIMIFSLVCRWKIFSKAHEEGWAAIVPIYNVYILFKITWGNGWLFLLMLIPLANLVIGIITQVKLAKAFGKGGGFACGLIFLSVIFEAILAFSNDIHYVGVPGKTTVDYGPGTGTGYNANGYQNPYQQNGYQNPYQQAGYQDPYQKNGFQQGGYQQSTYTQQSAQNPDYHYQRSSAASSGCCPYCGAPLEDGAKFCSSCGKQV